MRHSIVRTEAIVLRSVPYSETSLIVTLYTRVMGSVTVMAKGARSTRSKFGSAVQPMSYVQCVFYFKPSRTVQTLSECSHVVMFRNIGQDLTRLTTGMCIVEAARSMLPDPEANPAAFGLLLLALKTLDTDHPHVRNLCPYFQIRLASMLGFEPSVEKENVAQITDAGGWFDLMDGSVRSQSDHSAEMRGSRRALRAFAVLARADIRDVLRMRLDNASFEEVCRLTDSYLRYHIEGFRTGKAQSVLSQLSHGSE
jgi:DNA repair protein RecO (recombination protein O)